MMPRRLSVLSLLIASLVLCVQQQRQMYVLGLIPPLESKRHHSYHPQQQQQPPPPQISRRDAVFQKILGGGILGTSASLMLLFQPQSVLARLEPIDKPELLPKERNMNVIQTEKFLTAGQARRMNTLLQSLERDTGYRVRVLCQAYPNTPGLAIRDYWDIGKPETQINDKYVILIVDQFGGKGNVLNFNVGDGMKFVLPNIFWTRLQSKYGNTFYVRDNGIDLAITNAIEAIVSCLRSEEQYCINVPDEGTSLKSLGMLS